MMKPAFLGSCCDRMQQLKAPMDLILASKSPRRRMLLALPGWTFTVQPADVDERVVPGELPDAYVLRLAERKARAVAPPQGYNGLILAADTAVVLGEHILGKPANAVEAERMLRSLRGRVHWVYTAVAVYHPASGRLQTELGATEVPVRDFSDAEMRAYIATGDPLDKAGAYAIQHNGFNPVEKLEGCYANVVGLPLCHVTRLLAEFDLLPKTDVATACQAALGYMCPVFDEILRENKP